MNLPIWMYWEGECPVWIEACMATIFTHAADVRLITPAEFDKMWDLDRDINLTRLRIPHRADFIRAFLLARYGGLWIDADCIVINSLEPVLELLTDADFLAFSERQGDISNSFMGRGAIAKLRVLTIGASAPLSVPASLSSGSR